MTTSAAGYNDGVRGTNLTMDGKRMAAVAGVVLALWAAEIAVVGGLRYEWDLRAFALFGPRFADGRVVSDVPLTLPHGYDGQFYAALSTDPLLRRSETIRALDNPEYRAGRILLPATAWIVTGGSRDLAPLAYVWLCWIGALAGPLLVVLWSSRHGVSSWWGVALCLTPGVTMSMLRALPDGAAAALVISGLWAWSSERRFLSVGLFTLAVLCRETSLVFIVGAALYDLTRQRWRDAATLLTVPAVPWVLWKGWLVLREAGGRHAGDGNFAIPFEGLGSWLERWPRVPDWMQGPENAAMLGLGLLAIATSAEIIRRRGLTTATGALTAGLVLAVLLGDAVWFEVRAWGRVLTLLPLLGLVVMADSSLRVRRLIAASLVAFAVSGMLLGRIEWRQAVRSFERGEAVERADVPDGGRGAGTTTGGRADSPLSFSARAAGPPS